MSSWASALSYRLPWAGGYTDEALHFKAKWRGWARRWSFALVACGVAWSLGMWWHAQSWSDYALARHEVKALQAQLGAVSAEPVQTGKLAMVEVMADLPAPEQTDQMWNHLQKVLLQYRVRLLSMQPVNDALIAPLPSRAMVIRLQARYENWAQVWRVLAQMGPVWSMDRLSVVHSTDAQGVDIEVVWRIWSRDEGAARDQDQTPWEWPVSTLADVKWLQVGPTVFGLPIRNTLSKGLDAELPVGVQVGAASGVLAAPASAPEPWPQDLQFTHEPERWPMRPMRLVGTWRQGQQAQAIVANSTHWFRTEEGKPLSLEGHRVWRIGGEDMQVRDPQGRVQTIQMEAKVP